MTPLAFLYAMLGVCAAAVAVDALVRARVTHSMRRLAGQWSMHYTGRDAFDIARRVAQCFPIPGAAALAVSHLMYRQEGANYRYLFTISYTLGVVHAKRRHSHAATFTEPSERHLAAPDAGTFALAPEEGTLADQYIVLMDEISRGGAGDKDPAS